MKSIKTYEQFIEPFLRESREIEIKKKKELRKLKLEQLWKMKN